MLQVVLAAGDRLLPQPVAVAGVGVDVHKTRAYISALGIDHFTALRDGGGAHLAEAGDLAIFDKQNCLRDQMIPHHQLRIDNCDHEKTSCIVFYILPFSAPFCKNITQDKPKNLLQCFADLLTEQLQIPADQRRGRMNRIGVYYDGFCQTGDGDVTQPFCLFRLFGEVPDAVGKTLP